MSSRNTTGTLKDLKVIDLSRVLGGPYCTQILSDHGANVIKIEPPSGDETRDWGPPFQDDISSYFSSVNRNKRSIAIDLSKPEAPEVLFRLLENADIMVENFRAGTLERWGLSRTVIGKRFPRLIHCQISGFGKDGPFANLPGYDGAIQAWAGLLSINGDPMTGPVRMGLSIVDMVTGLNAAIGILMAAEERHSSGRGQFIEVALYDSALSLMLPYAHNYFMTGKRPTMMGNRSPNIAPYDLFATAGRSIFLAIGNDRQFQRLCAELDAPDIAEDARFASNSDRIKHREALTDVLRPLFIEHDGEALAVKLMKIGIPAGAALEVPEVMKHPQTLARQMVVQTGDFQGLGIQVKFDRTPGHPGSEPPAFSAHREDILSEAGFSDIDIKKFIEMDIILEKRRHLK